MIVVEFTQTAEDDYVEILDEITRNAIDEAIALDDKMNALVNNLKRYKHFCPPSLKFPKFRRCIVSKPISLVCEVGKQSITIVSIFDNRSNSPFTSS